MDQPVALQLTQVQGQHALGNPGQAALQRAEPPGPVEQLEQDARLPPAFNDGEGGLHPAWLCGTLLCQRQQDLSFNVCHGCICPWFLWRYYGTDLCVLANRIDTI